MGQIIGRISDSIVIESVVRESDRQVRHVYRIVGGPEDGREFDSMAEVGEYVVCRTEA